MNLLSYTKMLYNKINFYDKFFQDKNFESSINNPFLNKDDFRLTIVWVDNED